MVITVLLHVVVLVLVTNGQLDPATCTEGEDTVIDSVRLVCVSQGKVEAKGTTVQLIFILLVSMKK